MSGDQMKTCGELCRERVAKWAIENGYSTGHGDTLEDILVEMMDHRKRLREDVNTMRQAIFEVDHAQRQGPGWYTKGDSGLYEQVRLWLDRALDAAKRLE